MKKLLKILAVLLVLLLIAVGVLYTQLDRVVKGTVERFGPKVLQAPVTLEGVDLSIFSGDGRLSGLIVGNPEGFRTENAFVLDSLHVKLDPKSLSTDTIRIQEISIIGPEITYEGRGGKNLKQLQENAASFGKKPGEAAEAPAEEAPAEAPAAEEAPAKKVIIDRLVFQDGKINYSPAMGKIIPIRLPKLELTGIGEKSGGATGGQVLVQVLGQIDNAIIASIGNVGELAGKAAGAGIKTVGKAADIGVDAVGGVTKVGTQAVGSVAESAGGLVGKVPGMGGDGTNNVVSKTAGKLTESIGDAGGAVTENIGEGADKLVGGIKGLFGGEKKEEAAEPAAAEPEAEEPEAAE